ncbi:hypothetical protein N0V95_000403 [Ascochyta clinopodiicola]|nr:hypothetical protein N0V95_000403 [Ascochyta clinopodiicola]
MPPLNIQYTDDEGVTRSADIPLELRSYAADYLEALGELIEQVNRIASPDVAATPPNSPMTVEDGPGGVFDSVASEGTDRHMSPGGTRDVDYRDGLTAAEAEFLHDLGWANNDITSEEEAFLREHGPKESENVFQEEESSEAVLIPETPPVRPHEAKCRCSFPWNCITIPEPFPVFSDPTFGPVGTTPPIRHRTSESGSPRAFSLGSPTPSQIPAKASTAARTGYLALAERYREQREIMRVLLARRLEVQERLDAFEEAKVAKQTKQAFGRYFAHEEQQLGEISCLEVV